MLVDAHSHLQFSAFDKDRDKIIKSTLSQNIWVINVGANKESSQKALSLAQQYPTGVWATIGLHPHDIDEGFDYDFYKNLSKNPKVVAIGETGLDFYNNEKLEIEEDKEKQKEIFIKHIKLAKELNKPLMIHCRNAFDNLIKILISHLLFLNTPPGIIHFFTGTLRDAKKLLEMDFYFTFGGLTTFNRSFDEVIKFIPIKKILLETDSPYVAPEPYRGKRNEPAYIIEVAKKLAEIKNLTFEKISEQTTANAIDIFKIPMYDLKEL